MNGCGMRAECCRDQWKQTGLKHLFTLCLAIKSKATLTRLTFQQFNEGAKGPAGCTATVCVFYKNVHPNLHMKTQPWHTQLLYLCMRMHTCFFACLSCTFAHVCLFIFYRAASILHPFTSITAAPLRQRLHKQDNLESFSGRPGNVNRLLRNITPTGVCGCLQVWGSEGVSEGVRQARRERERGRGSVHAGVMEWKREIGLMDTEGWKVKVWFPLWVCV